VRPEPGSNSPIKVCSSFLADLLLYYFTRCSVFKEQILCILACCKNELFFSQRLLLYHVAKLKATVF
ncbi:hypothetical protein ACFSJH_16785, partial [Paenibacillus yanchengensis]